MIYSQPEVVNMDLLKSMEAFVLTVNKGSFAAAAITLNTSPQMVAKYIAFLESQLAITLLNRTTRSQSLTEFGKQYYARCITILADVKATKTLAQQFIEEPYGLLKISAPMSFGNFNLMPFISHFMKQYPRIEIELNLTDRYIDLVKEAFDIAFRIGHLQDSGLIARKIRHHQLIFAASPSYLAENGIPLHPDDLKNHRCLIYQYLNGTQRDYEWPFTVNGKLANYPISGQFKSNETFALMQAAIEGVGITMLPEMMLKEAFIQKKLLPILQSFSPPTKEMNIVYTADPLRLPKLKTFIEAAVDYFPVNLSNKNDMLLKS